MVHKPNEGHARKECRWIHTFIAWSSNIRAMNSLWIFKILLWNPTTTVEFNNTCRWTKWSWLDRVLSGQRTHHDIWLHSSRQFKSPIKVFTHQWMLHGLLHLNLTKINMIWMLHPPRGESGNPPQEDNQKTCDETMWGRGAPHMVKWWGRILVKAEGSQRLMVEETGPMNDDVEVMLQQLWDCRCPVMEAPWLHIIGVDRVEWKVQLQRAMWCTGGSWSSLLRQVGYSRIDSWWSSVLVWNWNQHGDEWCCWRLQEHPFMSMVSCHGHTKGGGDAQWALYFSLYPEGPWFCLGKDGCSPEK